MTVTFLSEWVNSYYLKCFLVLFVYPHNNSYVMIDLTEFETAVLTVEDGTTIGYRRIGEGPGIIFVHRGLQSSLNFAKLAKALSTDFTVYIPDRRGRGLSSAYMKNDNLITEAKDILALAHITGTTRIFGLSSGAIITLQCSLLDPSIQNIALYEPPIPLEETTFKKLHTNYEDAMGKDDLGRVFVAILKGTGDTSFLSRLPTFVLAPVLNLLIKNQSKPKNEIALRDLVPTFQHDRTILKDAGHLIAEAENLKAKVLLLQGYKSKSFLKSPLDKLATVINHTKRIEFKNQGHLAADNGGCPLHVA